MRGLREKIVLLEEICGREIGRNITSLVEYSKGNLYQAALSIATASNPAILILTGFFIPKASVAETDGPIGAAHLAAGLKNGNIPVYIATDTPCFPTVRTAIEAIDPSIPIYHFAPETSRKEILKWFQTLLHISHIIAIEKAGPAKDGIIYNMRGEDISSYTCAFDILFLQKQVVTIGIGDGGNELGMGVFVDELFTDIYLGNKIACQTQSDYFIVCGVSNWGAMALLLAVSLLHKETLKLKKYLSPQIDREILQTMIKKGVAVDGVLAQPALSVDGLPWEYHKEILLQMLHSIANV